MCNDPVLFIEILNSIPSIRFLRDEEINGIRAAKYEGVHGNLVIIDTTEDHIPSEVGRRYLKSLGLEDMIPSIFPYPPPAESDKQV